LYFLNQTNRFQLLQLNRAFGKYKSLGAIFCKIQVMHLKTDQPMSNPGSSRYSLMHEKIRLC